MRYTNTNMWGWLLAAVGMLSAGQVRADLISTTPYSLSISESQAVLANPGNDLVANMAALTTGHELAIERSEPYMLLTNTSDSSMNGSIVQFQMSIGDTADHFRFVEIISSASSSGAQLVSSSLGANNQELTLDFSGLPSGASVEFRVGLAPNDPNANPLVDYAHVFFNNGSNGEQNAVTSVSFTNPSLNATSTLGDQPAVAAASALTTTANCNCGNENVAVTAFNFQPNPTIVATPEPSSVVLLGLGLTGLGSVAWRGRRRLPQLRA
ncbi:MAG TPA: PEP-CTERM sorting domain-containing protein [Pirellulales bacterium]|nr:PEP-CTERM sorting domain-containing protein [Pirellulales bacterium]